MKIINKVLLILFVSLSALALFAQSDISTGSGKLETEINTFVQRVEGAGLLTAAVQAADGGYVTASRINRNRFLVRKVKVSGQKQWERMLDFGLLANIAGIAQTTDGGFVLAGFATLVKLGPNGTVSWKKNVMTDALGINFTSVAATPDGGFVATGVRLLFDETSDFLIIRFNPTGDVLWKKKFEGGLPQSGFFSYPLIPTPDNEYVIAFPTGGSFGIPPNGVDVMRISNSGNIVWKKSLVADDFVFQSLRPTVDGGAILFGTSENSFNKLFVIVLKANGTLNWNAEYSLNIPGKIKSVWGSVQTLDSGYVVTGQTFVNSEKLNRGFIAKIDSSHKIAFQNSLGNTNGPSAGLSVFATADGGFIVFGPSAYRILTDLFILKVNSEGIVPGCKLFKGSQFGSTAPRSFGPLTSNKANLTASNDLSIESLDLELTSVVTNHPVSTLCK